MDSPYWPHPTVYPCNSREKSLPLMPSNPIESPTDGIISFKKDLPQSSNTGVSHSHEGVGRPSTQNEKRG